MQRYNPDVQIEEYNFFVCFFSLKHQADRKVYLEVKSLNP
jgi:hypothetical protein